MRLLRSLLSILIIMLIVFTMIYTMVPRENIFFEDSTYRKLSSKSDDKTEYVYSTWEKLGYLDYVRINDYCLTLYEAGSPEMGPAVEPDSPETQDFIRIYTDKGYTIEKYLGSGRYYAYKDVPVIRRMALWLSKLIVIDTPMSVQDENNPDLPRSLSLGRTPTGGVALIGSGTTHKYLLYTDSHFPWLHQNIIKLNFGTSYPTYQGLDVMRVLFQSQGTEVKRHVTFETGYEADSGINFGSLKYKSVLDRMDKKKYGIIPGVTDRDYYTNSFHVPVYYKISAFKKLALEAPYHALTNAGHISYIELDGDPTQNLDAFEKIVRYMAEVGIGYGSINHPVDRDPVCGFVGVIGDVCPRCGRSEGHAISCEKLEELRKKFPGMPAFRGIR